MKRILYFVCVIFALALTGCDDDLFDDDYFWDDDHNRNPVTATVAQAKNLGDDINVMIVGTVQRPTSAYYRELYEFTDDTGTITVDIDYEAWYRGGVDPATLQLPARFTIIGEIDREYGYVEIDVNRVIRM